MKLVIAIVQSKDSATLIKRFTDEGIPNTKLASTGGFLKEGNTTFLSAVEERKVDNVLVCIKEVCQTREQVINQAPLLNGPGAYPVSVQVGGATVFIVDIEAFYRF